MLKVKKILFCGSSELSIGALDFLKSQNIFPGTIITQPARPVGRKKVLTETMVNNWAIENSINILKPEKFDSTFLGSIKNENFDICLVASYGKILKKEFLNIFPDGVWNIHPSALPKYRGATPLQAQIIDGLTKTTVTVIKMDEEMDHGEILGKEEMDLNWEETPISELEYQAGFTGGKIFYNEIDQQKLTKQDHTQATFTKILSKENGNVTEEIKKQNLDLVWRKYNAYRDWPGIYFIMKNLRVKITKMSKDLNSKKISIEKLLPESKNEIDLDVFEKNYGEIF